MKILIVSKCSTHPTYAGNSRFILDQVELFKEMEHEVYFLYIKDSALNPKNRHVNNSIDLLKLYWKDHLFIYDVPFWERVKFRIIDKCRKYFNNNLLKCDDHYPSGLHKYINKLNNIIQFDCCLINYYYLSKALQYINIPQTGIVTHDYFAYKNILVNDKNIPTATNAHEEAKAMQRAKNIFALNSEESIYFQKLSPLSKVYTIYSIFKYKRNPITNNKNILFLSGSNQFNINGIYWFVKTIFPIILKSFPDAKLIIGGSICGKIKELANCQNIELQGIIDDVVSFYNQGDVAINPTYQGTGLKIKTFEAISYDKVTLVHPHSKIGIYDIDNAPLFASDVAHEWVDFLNKLWSQPEYIKIIKEKNEIYIQRMNSYVKNEYLNFLNSSNINCK